MGDDTGFFMRGALGKTPGPPGARGPGGPDIIPAGRHPSPDPAEYVTPAGYGTDFGGQVRPGGSNYVYLRALGTGPAASPPEPITGRAWLFRMENDLAPWPRRWRRDDVTVAGHDGPLTPTRIVAVGAQTYTFQPSARAAARESGRRRGLPAAATSFMRRHP